MKSVIDDIINKVKKIFSSILNKTKEIFSNRRNIVILAIILIIIITFILIKNINNNKKNKFALNSIYDVYPDEVRNIYKNMVDVSCSGDLYLDIDLDSGKISIDKLNKNVLLNYLFSYLDKNNILTDSLNINVVKNAYNKLFLIDDDSFENISKFNYENYEYSLNGNNLVRTTSECKSDNYYVSQLYGYSYNNQELSIDVNIGYRKDNNLYDLSNNLLGEYDGDINKLSELFGSNSFYRFNYVKSDKDYKLKSVEFNSRT